jgi:hypothetical protein
VRILLILAVMALCFSVSPAFGFAEESKPETVKLNAAKDLVTDGVSIFLKDVKTGKQEKLVGGEDGDFLKSLSCDSGGKKFLFLKKGRVYIYEFGGKKDEQVNLGTPDVSYFKNVCISPDGMKLAASAVNIAGSAPDELWIADFKKFKDDEEYVGKRLITDEWVKEARWSEDSKTVTVTTEKAPILVDAEKVKVIKN